MNKCFLLGFIEFNSHNGFPLPRVRTVNSAHHLLETGKAYDDMQAMV